jgi:hypothetical protein
MLQILKLGKQNLAGLNQQRKLKHKRVNNFFQCNFKDLIGQPNPNSV